MIDALLRDGDEKLQEKGVSTSRIAPDAGNPQRLTREYFDSLQVELRMIDAVEASTRMELFGRTFATPVMVATLSFLDRIHPNGMVETARAAAEAESVMWAGIGGEDELAAMVDTGAAVVKIVKPYADHNLIFKKLDHAEKCGAFAVGMDISFFFARKNGTAPAPMSPKTIDDMKAFVKATKLPFIFKGVLSQIDAVKAVEAGAAAIVVSHHGGNVLDCALPPARILPRIAMAVADKIPVFADCGIMRGLDAFKALAAGADAVSVGRAVMAGLASAGAEGVKKVLNGITWELQRAMSMTGAKDLAHIDPESVWTPDMK